MKSYSLKVFTFYTPPPMPQMAPMNWAALFVYLNTTLALTLAKLHYE